MSRWICFVVTGLLCNCVSGQQCVFMLQTLSKRFLSCTFCCFIALVNMVKYWDRWQNIDLDAGRTRQTFPLSRGILQHQVFLIPYMLHDWLCVVHDQDLKGSHALTTLQC